MAARWYERQGYVLLDRNWRCREGEIDLVVARGRLVVFGEVKTRTSDAFGSPASAVTATKRARIRRVAMRWLEANAVRGVSLRFDVVSVIGRSVEVIEAAF